jgi:hypothetical protein
MQKLVRLPAPPAAVTKAVNAGVSRALPGLEVAPAWAWHSPVRPAASTAVAASAVVTGAAVSVPITPPLVVAVAVAVVVVVVVVALSLVVVGLGLLAARVPVTALVVGVVAREAVVAREVAVVVGVVREKGRVPVTAARAVPPVTAAATPPARTFTVTSLANGALPMRTPAVERSPGWRAGRTGTSVTGQRHGRLTSSSVRGAENVTPGVTACADRDVKGQLAMALQAW